MNEQILDELRERDSNQYIYFVRGLSIIEKLNENLFEAYFVGGVVRDLLLKLPFNDIDIATSATPEQVKKMFPEVDMRFADQGSVTLREGPMTFEITTFREEAYNKIVDGKSKCHESTGNDTGKNFRKDDLHKCLRRSCA